MHATATVDGSAAVSSGVAPALSLPRSANDGGSGPQALAVLLRVLGHEREARALAHECGPQCDEMLPLALVRAARRAGFRARLIETPATRLAALGLPAVGRHRSGHYFVVAAASEQWALVHEPGAAPRRVLLTDLAADWDGILVQVRPRDATAAMVPFGLGWFISALGRYRTLLAQVMLASAVVQLFALATPLMFQVIVDKVLVHRGLTTLDVLVLGLAAVALFEALLGGLRAQVFAHTACRIDVLLGVRLFAHLLRLPLAYFETRAVGQTVARVRELESVRDFLLSSAVTASLDLLFAAIFLGVMWLYSPTLTGVVLCAVLGYVVVCVVLSPVLVRRAQARFTTAAANQAFLFETVSGIETVKAMAVEPARRGRWEDLIAAHARTSLRATVLGAVGTHCVQLVSRLSGVLVLWLGARMVMSGELSIGQLIAFNMLAAQVNAPVLRLSQLWQDLQRFRIAIARLGDVLNAPTEHEGAARSGQAPRLRGGVTLEHVTFAYGTHGCQPCLEDVSIDIAPGEVVALVGRSGSGKSTIARLVQRMHAPVRGRVLLDGLDAGCLEPSWLRSQIGVVLQESVLFSASVRDNIALAVPGAPLERIKAVAQMAGAHEFITQLPEGYDTLLNERGANLSGGQRQRIAIARALLADPAVLIFDEATSALDLESEQALMANMRAICRGRTVILIAHRLSTVRHAARVVVLEGGKVVEQGAQAELRSGHGHYAALWRQQRA